jgi:hypothetical protein
MISQPKDSGDQMNACRKTGSFSKSNRGQDPRSRPRGASSEFEDFSKLFRGVFPAQSDILPHSSSSPTLKADLSRPLECLKDNCSRADVSAAASLFLFRKVLPSPQPDIEAYLAKLGRNLLPTRAFLDLVEELIPSMFPVGWDSRYPEYCSRAIPSASSSTESSRKHGGARGEVCGKMSAKDFEFLCSVGCDFDPVRKVASVNVDGKARIVTVASAWQGTLQALHHLIYDHISDTDWLQRGDATANSFAEFERVRGEVFVSGDYEAATDNLNKSHSIAILQAIFKNARSIPAGVRKSAIDSLSGVLSYGGSLFPQLSAQLMGNLLSFPLLCLTNFLGFVLAFPGDWWLRPLKINGDDIVFRGTRSDADHWMMTVSQAGLTLSKGKTLVHERFFSLNSTYFEGRSKRRPTLVPVIRSKSIYSRLTQGDGVALAARLRESCRGFWPGAKRAVRAAVLRFHRRSVSGVGCSFSRGLGIRLDKGLLMSCRLLDQEVHHLKGPAGVDKPRAGVDRTEIHASRGWTRVPSTPLNQEYRGLWGVHCREIAWQLGVRGRAITGNMDPPRYGYTPARYGVIVRKVMGQSKRSSERLRRSFDLKNHHVKRWLNERQAKFRRAQTLWVPKELALALRRDPKFQKGN